MLQQDQIPINYMVPKNPLVPMGMQVPMPIQMQLPFQMQIPMPLQLSFPLQETGQSNIGKRRREDEAPGTVGAEQSTAKRAKGQDVIFRIVVPSRQIGKVIGKVGCRIQKIREETKATIKIADAIARHEERVIIISSRDNDDKTTDAENALQQIANLILKEDDSNVDASKVTAGHMAANTIRLLIAGSQAGGLIGMSGQNIVKLRSSSGATITVLAPNQLPLCASAHESDRVVQVYGGKGEQKHRQIQFGGSAQQVALAKQRVDEYIYSQLIQQGGSQQSGFQ